MALIVMKFGGTSVGDLDRIRHVAKLIHDHIKRSRENGNEDKVCVVASAMAGETNRLLAMAKSCVKEPAPRELDAMVATGELVSVSLLAMALIELGIKAKSMSAHQAHISTDRRYMNAQIQEIDDSVLLKALDAGEVPVVAGFQGIDENGDMTTLGRGGSDITAVALAAALKADACYIYTDVRGVYSTDPRICREAKLLKKVCHEEMLEMASLGAKVLHPRSVYFAMVYKIPLVVLSTFEPNIDGSEGTWIVKEEELMEKPIVTGITYRTDEARITVTKLPSGSRALGQLFSILAQENIFIDMISQTRAGSLGDFADVSFTVPDESSTKALEVVQRLVPELEAQGAYCDRDIAKVSVVGVGMRYHSGVAAKMFSALAKEKIDISLIGTSEIKISVIVPRKYCELAVRTLHESFIEDRCEVREES